MGAATSPTVQTLNDRPRRLALLVAALTALALGIRLHNLDASSLWMDEATQVSAYGAPGLGACAVQAARHSQPPLDYLIGYVLYRLLPRTDFVFRLPAALMGAALVPLTVLLLIRLLPPRASLVGGLLVAVSPRRASAALAACLDRGRSGTLTSNGATGRDGTCGRLRRSGVRGGAPPAGALRPPGRRAGEAWWGDNMPAGIVRFERGARLLARALRERGDPRALEMGCGAGGFTRYVLAEAPELRLEGVDISPKTVALAAERLQQYAGATFTVGTAAGLPHGDARFDAVVGNSILHHIDLARAPADQLPGAQQHLLHRLLGPGLPLHRLGQAAGGAAGGGLPAGADLERGADPRDAAPGLAPGLPAVLDPLRGLPGDHGRAASSRGPDQQHRPVIHVVIGTQAECIKVAPVLCELRRRGIDYNLVQAGQHPVRLTAALELFGLPAPAASLSDGAGDVTTIPGAARWLLRLAGRGLAVGRLQREVFRGAGGVCLVHGDTLSTLVGATLARLAGLRVAHLEGGLRSHDSLDPFPEEVIRSLTTRLASVLFAPNAWAAGNLRRYARGRRVVTLPDNTVRDSLALMLARDPARPAGIAPPYGVATIHRFETIYSRRRLALVCRLLRRATQEQPLVLALHDVTLGRLARYGLLEQISEDRIVRLPFLSYDRFLALLRDARFVIADGGSIQEEASYLGLPALILRRRTERVEGLGRNVVISEFSPERVERFLADPERHRHAVRPAARSASAAVVDAIESYA